RAGTNPAGLWPGTSLLLRPAHLSHPPAGRCRGPFIPPTGVLVVAWSHVRARRASGIRTWPALYLRNLVPGSGDLVPTMPLVHGIQAAASGLDVVKLSLSCWPSYKPAPSSPTGALR